MIVLCTPFARFRQRRVALKTDAKMKHPEHLGPKYKYTAQSTKYTVCSMQYIVNSISEDGVLSDEKRRLGVAWTGESRTPRHCRGVPGELCLTLRHCGTLKLLTRWARRDRFILCGMPSCTTPYTGQLGTRHYIALATSLSNI